MTVIDVAALGALVGVVATMPVFALRSRERPVDADVARRPVTILLGVWVRDWLMWFIGPIERGLVRAHVSPDLLNYLGVVFGIAAGVAFATGSLALAGAMILLGGVADVLDGRIARARAIASAYGAFLDSTLDRFAEAFAFIGVAWFLADRRWTVAATMLALGGSLLVSYTRARGEALGVECKGGVMQRAERLVLLALAGLLDAAVAGRTGWPPGTLLAGAVSVIGLGSLGTAIYRTAVIARALALRG